jgi:AraC-like DNA-binding protein
MNRTTAVFRSASVTIERFDHPAHRVHSDQDSEITHDVAVTFVEGGRFALQESRSTWTFQIGDVLVSTPGIPRCYRHFEECPDDVCLSISFVPESVEDALGNARKPSPLPRISRAPATEFAYFLIRSAVASRDTLWIEEAAFHSLLALASDSWDHPPRELTSGAHAHRIRNAIELMSEQSAEEHSLSSISRELGMSPFHFARTFSGLVGLSPHQYLLHIRLRRSAMLLRLGASVTDAALNSGFENLAHFSRSFRRRFGVNPSKYSRTRL